MAIVCDIETVPQDREQIEKRMPEEVRNPVMPEELANPEEPNFSEKCPKYASIKDTKERELRKVFWIEAQQRKWQAKCAADRSKWEQNAAEARERFFSHAALDARLGHAKLIGVKDTHLNVRSIYAWEPDAERAGKLRKWLATLPRGGVHSESQFDSQFKGAELCLNLFMREGDMLTQFFDDFVLALNPTGEQPNEKHLLPWTDATRPNVVTYFGNTFDFPFLFRRAWILGVRANPSIMMQGRYFDRRFIDLHERWQMGDRGEASGGLDGLLDSLQVEHAKTQDGASFHEWYAKDPVEGICYLANELDATHAAGVRMGAI